MVMRVLLKILNGIQRIEASLQVLRERETAVDQELQNDEWMD